jgi:hypothetical protein
MSHYLLSIHTAEGEAGEQPAPAEMQEYMRRVIALEADMEATGTFVFGGRLADPDAATVVRSAGDDPVMTDGPFVESKEHIAGFYIIEADDLDAALAWANRVVDTVNAPIEVRPFFATGRVADQIGEMRGE